MSALSVVQSEKRPGKVCCSAGKQFSWTNLVAALGSGAKKVGKLCCAKLRICLA